MKALEYTQETLAEICQMEPQSSEMGREAVEMLRDLKKGNKVCLLKKAFYDLRQAGSPMTCTIVQRPFRSRINSMKN